MKTKNSRLTPFIGNDYLCESEYNGEIYKECYHGQPFLEPVSKHQAYLHNYAIQVQQALNVRKSSGKE